MTINIHDRFSLHAARVKEIANDPQGTVTYWRRSNGYQLSGLVATYDVSPEIQESVPGIVATRSLATDFVFDAKDLIEAGVQFLPEDGDTITRAGGEIYRVASNGEAVYQLITTNNERIRVHAKLTDA